MADYDGGLVGQALIQTVRQRYSKLLPMTYEVIDTTSLSYSELSEHVNWGWYHSALVVPAGTSQQLQDVLTASLAGRGTAAACHLSCPPTVPLLR